MLGETAVLLLVTTEMFLRAPFHAAGDCRGKRKEEGGRRNACGRIRLPRINTLYEQKILAVADNCGVDGIGGGVAEGEKVDGIEDVGFADAVAANHAVDLRREVERGLPDVLIVDE